MSEQTSIEKLKQSGRVNANSVSRWREAAELMAILDGAGRDGANVVVKIDGGRPEGSVYTVVISGPIFGESFFRKDGDDLLELLREAIDYYVQASRI